MNLKQTSLDEWVDFLENYDLDRRGIGTMYANQPLEDYLQGEVIVFYFEETIYISSYQMSFNFDEEEFWKSSVIRFYQPGDWLSEEVDHISIRNILSQIEEMPEIYIFQNLTEVLPATDDEPENYLFRNPRPYEYPVMLYFREQGVKAYYLFRLLREGQNEDAWINDLQLCPTLENTISLDLTLSGDPITEERPDSESWSTPEEAFGLYMDTEALIAFFLDNPDGCVNVYGNRDE
ncbi:MAG: hypothetical protein SF029_02990 [bacterium]|nr:hypothetical protein [bacterium]